MIWPWELRTTFSTPLIVLCTLLLLFFGLFVRYDPDAANDAHVAQYYGYLRDVAVMIFVGFGFLMTFLRHYSYSAIGLNFLCSCVMILEYIFVGGAVNQELFRSFPNPILLDLPLIINGLFCAAAGMITFGAVLGKTTPSQMLWLCIWQVPFYSLNQWLVYETFGAMDIGGSISIHAFGAYYGLAASMFLSKPGTGMLEHTGNTATYTTDMTAMIGSLFLWLYWPSFNGALASQNSVFPAGSVEGQQQFLCIVNTLLSLMGSVLATFAMSSLLHKKFEMFQIQNASLAGGVAMGAAANMRIAPVGALAVGIMAGSLSTLGFSKVMPYLETRIGLRDTCGVHYLHGLPGLLGGLVAAIASVAAFGANEELLGKGHAQFGYQILAMTVTVAIAVTSGSLGAICALYVDPHRQQLPVLLSFEDAIFWGGVDCDDEAHRHATRSVAGVMASTHRAANDSKRSAVLSVSGLDRQNSHPVQPCDFTVLPTVAEAVLMALEVDESKGKESQWKSMGTA